MSLLSIVQQAQYLAYRMHQASNSHIDGVVRDFVLQSKQLQDSMELIQGKRSRSHPSTRAGGRDRVLDRMA